MLTIYKYLNLNVPGRSDFSDYNLNGYGYVSTLQLILLLLKQLILQLQQDLHWQLLQLLQLVLLQQQFH